MEGGCAGSPEQVGAGSQSPGGCWVIHNVLCGGMGIHDMCMESDRRGLVLM